MITLEYFRDIMIDKVIGFCIGMVLVIMFKEMYKKIELNEK